MQTLECSSCPENFTINQELRKCIQTIFPPNITNPLNSSTISGPLPEVKDNDFTCPITDPYFIGGKCIRCD